MKERRKPPQVECVSVAVTKGRGGGGAAAGAAAAVEAKKENPARVLAYGSCRFGLLSQTQGNSVLSPYQQPVLYKTRGEDPDGRLVGHHFRHPVVILLDTFISRALTPSFSLFPPFPHCPSPSPLRASLFEVASRPHRLRQLGHRVLRQRADTWSSQAVICPPRSCRLQTRKLGAPLRSELIPTRLHSTRTHRSRGRSQDTHQHAAPTVQGLFEEKRYFPTRRSLRDMDGFRCFRSGGTQQHRCRAQL